MIQLDKKIFPQTPGAYIVGGSIRDLLCRRAPVDYDVAVLGDPIKFARQIENSTNGRLIEIGKPGQMIIRVVSEKHIIDVSSIKKASIEEDLDYINMHLDHKNLIIHSIHLKNVPFPAYLSDILNPFAIGKMGLLLNDSNLTDSMNLACMVNP